MADLPFVTDTTLNQYAIDPTTYLNAKLAIVGYMRGARVLVMYYRRLKRGTADSRSNITDYPTQRDVLSESYQKIINLEITLKQGLEFTADPERAAAGVVGEAWFYPNMNPSVGDMLTFALGDGRIGIFQITQVNRMNWRSLTTYSCQMSLQSFLDVGAAAPMEGAVVDTVVFDKTNYLGGTAALLSSQTYVLLQQIKAMRTSISKYFHSLFYNKDKESYFWSLDKYDAHAVQFVANKISMKDVHYRARNLMGSNPGAYAKTVWGRLEERYTTSLAGVYPVDIVYDYAQTSNGVFVTGLRNSGIITPVKAGTDGPVEPYVFSQDFYDGDLAAMSPFEKDVYLSITTRLPPPPDVLFSTYLSGAMSLADKEAFYKLPIYLHFIDQSLQSGYTQIQAPSMNFASTGG